MAEMNDIYSVARVRVKEKYLLTDQDIEQLLQQKDEAALLGMLSDKGWAKDVAEPEAHAVLASEEARAMADLRDLCPDPEILEAIRYHTIGHAGACKLTMVLKLADTLEDGRSFDEAPVLRKALTDDLEALMRQLWQDYGPQSPTNRAFVSAWSALMQKTV